MESRAARAAVGRWKGLLSKLGVDVRYLTGRHGPCPKCGGKDRFRFDDLEGRGTWFCNECGAGDGFGLLEAVHGWRFREAAQEVERILGEIPPDRVSKAKTKAKSFAEMKRVWGGSHGIERGDPVDQYLRGRGIDLDQYPAELRTHERLEYVHDYNRCSYHPAMLALVRDRDGRAVNVHRTYLNGATRTRKMMAGHVPRGSAVRLQAPQNGVVGVGEGIETCQSASQRFGMPVWALLNTGSMQTWQLPADIEIRRVVIFADNDPKFGGQAAAFALAHRLACKHGIAVSVEIPERVGADWNDA